MDQMRVDVVVAIYNVEEYLDACLSSLVNQSYSNYKLILVNDGSTDNSLRVINRYKENYSHLIEVINKENGGLSDARNVGLLHSTAEFIFFIDGDDFVEKNMIESCMKVVDDSVDMVVFDYNQYHLQENRKERINLDLNFNRADLKQCPEMLAKIPNAAWNKMYRRTLLTENGIYYPYSYRHQDLGTTAKLLLQARKVVYLKEALYNYLLDRPNNITQQVDRKLYHILAMVKEIVLYYHEAGEFENYQSELLYLAQINCSQSLKKAMRLRDKKFVFQFIDDVFLFYKQYFKKVKPSYDSKHEIGSGVYLNKELTKLYYVYRSMKGSKDE